MEIAGTTGGRKASRPMPAERASRRAFLGASALVFAASAAATVAWCGPMSGMAGMPMAGGWTMSMTWMRMPGQTWPGVAASFLGMWAVMMVAMMLPSLVPSLWRYRQAAGGAGEPRPGGLTVLVGLAYFSVWTAVGAAVYPLGLALAAAAMHQPALSRAVPLAAGAVVLIAGLIQLTSRKAHHLACCRAEPGSGRDFRPDAATAWRHGLRLARHCVCCCGNLMAILLVAGVMDLLAMAVVTAAITSERLLPVAERIARGIGVIVVAAGVFLVARAVGVG